MRSHLKTVGLLIALLAIVGSVPGCTSSAYSCSGSSCSITLNGVGADVEADLLGITVRLEDVADGRAEISVNGETTSVAVGDTVDVAGVMLRCVSIDDESVELEVSI